MKLKLKLSQCMIVKNEEHNIERALSWGKELMYEQIVVDTGSTDRTVEIAKQLGAKVYSFEWNDDFSAAKNFALSKAKGDWIAFLDADEYIHTNDIEKLVVVLNKIWDLNKLGTKIKTLRLRIYNLNDKNGLTSGGLNERFYVNDKRIRYKNRVHEQLTLSNKDISVTEENISILHTGYTTEEYQSKHKIERNKKLILREIEEKSEDDKWWYYLGTMYFAEEEYQDALAAYKRVVQSQKVRKDIILLSMVDIIKIYIRDKEAKKYEDEVKVLYQRYKEMKYDNPDIEMMVALYDIAIGKKEEALTLLEECLGLISTLKDYSMSYFAIPNLSTIYKKLGILYMQKNQMNQAVHSLTLAIKLSLYDTESVSFLLDAFHRYDQEIEEVYGFLGKIYNFNRFKDKFFIMEVAKQIQFKELQDKIYAIMTKEEQDYISNLKEDK